MQEDGATPQLASTLPDDPRVRYDALGVQAGSPVTRNAALGRARGAVVIGLDHDDCFAPDGLAALLDALTATPGAAWACGRCDWLLPDGGHWAKPDVLAAGLVAPGVITRGYLDTDDWPFPAAFTLYRRHVLLAAGGWPAMPRSEDAGLLLGVAHSAPGVWVDRIVATYRRWDGQKTVRAEDLALRPAVHATLRTRAEALLQRG